MESRYPNKHTEPEGFRSTALPTRPTALQPLPHRRTKATVLAVSGTSGLQNFKSISQFVLDSALAAPASRASAAGRALTGLALGPKIPCPRALRFMPRCSSALQALLEAAQHRLRRAEPSHARPGCVVLYTPSSVGNPGGTFASTLIHPKAWLPCCHTLTIIARSHALYAWWPLSEMQQSPASLHTPCHISCPQCSAGAATKAGSFRSAGSACASGPASQQLCRSRQSIAAAIRSSTEKAGLSTASSRLVPQRPRNTIQCIVSINDDLGHSHGHAELPGLSSAFITKETS